MGANPAFERAALELAQILAARRIELVFGGTDTGLMGVLSNEILRLGGRAIGVVPQSEVLFQSAQQDLSELHIVASMHERKAKMADLSDGFLMLPGGLGTLDEFFEAATWNQLGIHQKPCALVNIGGFFDDLLGFLDRAVSDELIKSKYRAQILSADNVGNVLEKMEDWELKVAT